MSEENVQLFRRGLAAWNERDFGAIVEMCHPDVEWTFSDRLPDTTGDIRRMHAVSDFLARFTEDWSRSSPTRSSTRAMTWSPTSASSPRAETESR